jgi:hypothetical protein
MAITLTWRQVVVAALMLNGVATAHYDTKVQARGVERVRRSAGHRRRQLDTIVDGVDAGNTLTPPTEVVNGGDNALVEGMIQPYHRVGGNI